MKFSQMKHRFRFYRVFFWNTLPSSVTIGLALALLYPGDFIGKWMLFIPTAGLGCDLMYKEFTRKEDYFFFYNQGIRKIELWIATFILSASLCFILNQVIQLCVRVWK